MTETTFAIVRPNRAANSDEPTRGVTIAPVDPRPLDAPAGFELGEVLGQGGMGVVVRARDLALGRDVAVKLLTSRFAADSAIAARFADEARVTGQLQHPGVPAVYQAGLTPGGRPFLAMKLIEGCTLEALLKAGEVVNAAAVFEAVCHAVGYAHSRGVIHRDLKPANIMVGGFGEVQVMDWGIAKVLGQSDRLDAPGGETVHFDSQTPVTQAGSVLGTPAYMPPEQAIGSERVDPRSDVFGLGAVLCALLTGQPPFTGDSESARLRSARGDTAEALARLDGCGADLGLVTLCQRCLSVNPLDRPADGGAVATAVAAWRAVADERARRAELDAAELAVRAAEQSRRRVVIVRMVAVVAATLVFSLAATATGLVQARRAQADAELARDAEADQKRDAEASAQAARESAALETSAREFSEDIISYAKPLGHEGGLGREVTLLEAIDAATAKLDAQATQSPVGEARLRYKLFMAYSNLGQYQKARSAAARCVTLAEVANGVDGTETLVAKTNLAQAENSLGHHEDARRLAAYAAEQLSARLGPNARRSLVSRQTLAKALTGLGRHTEALLIQQTIWQAFQETAGPNHLDTMDAAHGVAQALLNTGRPAEALPVLRQLVTEHEAISGRDGIRTLDALALLASALARTGDAAGALKLRERVAADTTAKLGLDHTNTLTARSRLAESWATAGRHAEAVAIYSQTLAAQKRICGMRHVDTIVTANYLVQSLQKLGRFADALPIQKEAAEAMATLRGPDSPEALLLNVNLASGYYHIKRPADAIAILEQVYPKVLRLMPGDAYTLHQAADLLIRCHGELGQLDKISAVADAYTQRARGSNASAKRVNTIALLVSNRLIASADADGLRTNAARFEGYHFADADSFYNAACYRAIAARAAKKAGDNTHADADTLQAVTWLSKAVAAGYRDPLGTIRDKDLADLRGRPDFQNLLQAMVVPKPHATK